MRFIHRFLALAVLGLLPLRAFADYLEIKRPALLKAEPTVDADTIEHLSPPMKVRIIDNDQQNGYYHVELQSGQQGFVYRTLGRRQPGDLFGADGAGATPSRTAGGTALASRAAAAKEKKAQPCVANLAACPDSGCADPESQPEHALLNTLKHAQPTGTPLTFKQFRLLQSKTNALHLPSDSERNCQLMIERRSSASTCPATRQSERDRSSKSLDSSP